MDNHRRRGRRQDLRERALFRAWNPADDAGRSIVPAAARPDSSTKRGRLLTERRSPKAAARCATTSTQRWQRPGYFQLGYYVYGRAGVSRAARCGTRDEAHAPSAGVGDAPLPASASADVVRRRTTPEGADSKTWASRPPVQPDGGILAMTRHLLALARAKQVQSRSIAPHGSYRPSRPTTPVQ